ncbi:MAG: hypothetical protein ABF441_13705 [Lentilactobacillus hilgardii]|uniref:hypothetical protein n=1 Tax=Lentilactobacillus hilgardii TaxID=1588 RepID=UPI0039E951AC
MISEVVISSYLKAVNNKKEQVSCKVGFQKNQLLDYVGAELKRVALAHVDRDVEEIKPFAEATAYMILPPKIPMDGKNGKKEDVALKELAENINLYNNLFPNAKVHDIKETLILEGLGVKEREDGGYDVSLKLDQF